MDALLQGGQASRVALVCWFGVFGLQGLLGLGGFCGAVVEEGTGFAL
ncbi:hypothetical protein ACN3VN_06885 [Xylella fastidiosa]